MSGSQFGSLTDLTEPEGGSLYRLTPKRELQKILECPVCQAIPCPPIYNCLQGHGICSKCRNKIEKCPICQSLYTYSRNFALEAIVETSSFACENLDQGCKEIVFGKEFQKHLLECNYRSIHCHLGSFHNCHNSEIEIKRYLSHLINVHKVQQCDRAAGNSFAVAHILRDSNVSDVSWCGKYVEFDGKLFLTRSFLHMDTFHFCLVFIGEDCDASNYGVKIKLDSRMDDKKTLPFEITMPVIPVRLSDNEITEGYLHGILNKSCLMRVCEKEDLGDVQKLRWEVRYEIMKL